MRKLARNLTISVVVALTAVTSPAAFAAGNSAPASALVPAASKAAIPTSGAVGPDGTIRPGTRSWSPERIAFVADWQTRIQPYMDMESGWTGSTDTCTVGSVSSAYREGMLVGINYARGLAGIPPVSMDGTMSAQADAASLIMQANGRLDHFPTPDWKCYSAEGYTGASRSNLSAAPGIQGVFNMMDDPGDTNYMAGHRRWLLSSKVGVVGVGSSSQYSAVNVIGGYNYNAPVPARWVAFPTPGLFPSPLFEYAKRMSATYPGANFSQATVKVTSNGHDVPTVIRSSETFIGENTLVWDLRVNDVPDFDQNDYPLDVQITGVRDSAGNSIDYSYSTRVINPVWPDVNPLEIRVESLFWMRKVPNTLQMLWFSPDYWSEDPDITKRTATAVPVKGGGPAKTVDCVDTNGAYKCVFSGLDSRKAYRVTAAVVYVDGQSAAIPGSWTAKAAPGRR